jgi:monoamine oxidase
MSTPLTAIKLNNDGSYTLTFANGAGSFTKIVDQVVLTMPFSVLRGIDFSKAGFNQVKTWAINELGMGTNSKLHLQFNSRFWRDAGLNGETYSDRGYQNTWEVTRAQPGARVLPGATAQWNGKVVRDYWTGNQWSKGSYSYWKVGQYTRFSGAEKEQSGNCHFAGEHTSQDFQGYLQGAVETGQRAASEILKG